MIIETTGLADPAPVAQTFFVDAEIQRYFKLDGIVTVIDAKHFLQHLDEEKPEGVENECHEQVEFHLDVDIFFSVVLHTVIRNVDYCFFEFDQVRSFLNIDGVV